LKWARADEDFQEPGTVRWLAAFIPAAMLLMALALGLLLGRVTAPQTVQVRTVPLAPGSARMESGVPVGFAHSEAGAVDAATAYAVALNGPILLDPAALRAAAAAIALPQYQAELIGQGDKGLQALNTTYGVQSNARAGATPAVKLVPIAYKLESYSAIEARVDIWAVWLIAEAGILAPQQNWITLQLSLNWLDSDWKMDASGAHPGPVPQPPQGAVAEQSQLLPAPLTTDYTEYKHVGS
jgi:hypothetical protein